MAQPKPVMSRKMAPLASRQDTPFRQEVRAAVARLRTAKRPDFFDAALARWALPDSEIEAILRSKGVGRKRTR